MRNLFFQGDDARHFMNEWEAMEDMYPEKETREILLDILDAYL